MKLLFVLVGFGFASNADAGVYADAFAKSDKRAIATLREHEDDAAARCTLGAIYAKKHDLPRATLYLAGCSDVELPDEISAIVARANRDVAKKKHQLSSIAISLEPKDATLTAQISALPGETFTVPATIWVKAGTYDLEATDGQLTYKQQVTVKEFSRTSTVLDTKPKKVPPPKTGKADFRDEAALEKPTEGSPAAVKRRSLMTDKYLGLAEGPAGNLEDPLAVRQPRRVPLPYWLGLRVGGGMFDDGASDARVGGAFGVAARYALAPRYFLSARFDWSRRGGRSIDVLGASAGAGANLVDGIALIAQLRADVRFGADDGASAAANVEVMLPATPITAGLRFEHGLTELVPGARDRALLLEVGVDWR